MEVEGQQIEMPTQDDKLKFEHHFKKLRRPFVVYADFECLTEELKKPPGGLETGPIFQTKFQVRSTFHGLTCGGHEIFAQHVCVSPLPLAAVGHERALYFPRPLRTQGIWHPIFDVLPKNVNIPKPPICVAMRSIKHVCKFKEC